MLVLLFHSISSEHHSSESHDSVLSVKLTASSLGFLGSGKTTFVQYILTQQHGRKIAVIQNEFGQPIGVEEAMVMGSDGSSASEWLDLPNGCVCCSVRDDLVLTSSLITSRLFLATTGLQIAFCLSLLLLWATVVFRYANFP